MGYYVRVLTPNISLVAQTEIVADLSSAMPGATLHFFGDDERWSSCEISRGGRLLSVLTRDIDDSNDTLVADEVGEFIEMLDHTDPQNASRWLQDWLKGVKAIYTFQILGACESNADWACVGAVKAFLWNKLGGIFQADREGFSNEEGYQIVWQFSDSVTGRWNMAVLAQDGGWKNFEMDLGNSEHRRAFRDGKIPAGCR